MNERVEGNLITVHAAYLVDAEGMGLLSCAQMKIMSFRMKLKVNEKAERVLYKHPVFHGNPLLCQSEQQFCNRIGASIDNDHHHCHVYQSNHNRAHWLNRVRQNKTSSVPMHELTPPAVE